MSLNTQKAFIRCIDRLIKEAKSAAIWDDWKAMCLFVGGKYQNCYVPIKRGMPTPKPFNFVAADWNRVDGLKGGSTKYIDSNRNNNADPQNDQSVGAFLTERVNNNGAILQGGRVESGTSSIASSTLDGGRIRLHNRSSSASNHNSSTGDTKAYVAMSRGSPDNFIARSESVNQTVSTSSQPPVDRNFLVLARHNEANTGVDYFGIHRLALYHIGEATDLATNDEIFTRFMDRITVTNLYGDIWLDWSDSYLAFVAEEIRLGWNEPQPPTQ